jgi:hypothetical protein
MGIHRIIPWVLALAGMALWLQPARADWSASLPLFTPCNPSAAPEMPERWRAAGLMMPFLQGQLDVGEFIYDGALPAMRASVYGLESGAVDLLITADDTYVLTGPHRAPQHCKSVGRKLRLPSAQWLSGPAVCLGEAPVAGRAAQWWQKTGFDPARYWMSSATRLPARAAFLHRTLDPAVIGDYAMTYFADFTPLPQTGLAALRDLCAHADPADDAAGAATPTTRDLMAVPNPEGEAERVARIAVLIPGLSHEACARASMPQWPDRYVMTAIITPIKMTEYPYPTLIYYDWSKAETLLVLPFHGSPPVLQGVISLKKRIGYRIKLPAGGGDAKCAPILPGIVRPDWMKAAACECRGVIGRNTALGADEDTEILSCPIKAQGQRVMWNWYTAAGRPVMFTEAMPEGGGVMLADYADWLPGQTGQPSDFELPKICTPASADTSGAASVAGSSFSNVSCSDCHTTTW